VRLANAFRIAAAFCVGVLALSTNAQADFVTAYGWVSTEAIVSSATGGSPASLALGTCHNGVSACTFANADVKFTTTGINFSATSANISTWLASSAFTLNSLVDNAPGSPMDPTIWEFVGNISVTGTVATPQNFTFAHDDGMTFVVNGQTVVNDPKPTSPVSTNGSYSGGVNGNAPFQIVYSECCGGPAVLQTSLVGPQTSPVPEPRDGVWLLGAVLAAVGLVRRRKLSVA
jgi:hypothetical protein